MPEGSLAAVGVVVQDLERSIRFYTDLVGMKEVRRIDVPQMSLVESVMTFPGAQGASIVLMRYSDGQDRSYVDNGAKIVIAVDDAVALAEAVRVAGWQVTREPHEYPGFGLITMVKDPDGHTIEAVQARVPTT